MTMRLRLALQALKEPLPEQVKKVIDSSFPEATGNKSVEEENEAFLQKHKPSASHVQAAVQVRQALDAEKRVSENVKLLQESVTAPGTTIAEALEGLSLAESLTTGGDSRTAYVEAARKHWPEASVFH